MCLLIEWAGFRSVKSWNNGIFAPQQPIKVLCWIFALGQKLGANSFLGVQKSSSSVRNKTKQITLSFIMWSYFKPLCFWFQAQKHTAGKVDTSLFSYFILPFFLPYPLFCFSAPSWCYGVGEEIGAPKHYVLIGTVVMWGQGPVLMADT